MERLGVSYKACWPSRLTDAEAPREDGQELKVVIAGASRAAFCRAPLDTVHICAGTCFKAAVFMPGDMHPVPLSIRYWPGQLDSPSQCIPDRPSPLAGSHRVPRVPAELHAVQLLSPLAAAAIASESRRACVKWESRGVSLPTQDMCVSQLSSASQALIYDAIKRRLVPFAKAHYPHLAGKLEKNPYPKPGNLFIVRYRVTEQRGLRLHSDDTALTFNCCLSAPSTFAGGGTFFTTGTSNRESLQLDGLVVRPASGVALVHDGHLIHAGSDILLGERLILVGFYTEDGPRDVRRPVKPKPPAEGRAACPPRPRLSDCAQQGSLEHSVIYFSSARRAAAGEVAAAGVHHGAS